MANYTNSIIKPACRIKEANIFTILTYFSIVYIYFNTSMENANLNWVYQYKIQTYVSATTPETGLLNIYLLILVKCVHA